MRFFGCCGLFVLASCASAPAPSPVFPHDDGQTQASLLDARRKLAEAEYDEAPPTTVIDGVELRVSELDMAEVLIRKRARRPRSELRVPLQNPWRLGADRDAYRAEIDRRVADIDVERTWVDSVACFQGVDGETYRLQVEAWERLRDDMAEVQAWMDTLLAEQLITAPAHRVRSLGIQNRLLRTRPGPPPIAPESASRPLPAMAVPPGPLDLRDETLEQTLLAHPLWARLEAEQQHLERLSDREDSKRLPWLAWISLGYTPRFAGERPIVEGRFAVELPLGLEARSEAQALELRAASARLEADGQMLSQLRSLQAALSSWVAWEAEIPQLLDAQAAATEHRRVALEWIQTRGARPAEAESLIQDTFDIYWALIDTRSQAGGAGCRVQALSGVHPTQWPRL